MSLLQRIARCLVGGPRGTGIDRLRLRLAVAAREHQHAVDDFPVLVPALLKSGIKPVLGGFVPDPLEAALGLGNGPVELRHVPFGRGHLRRIRRQQVAALDGAEVGGVVAKVAKRPRGRQPALGDIGREQIEIAQPPDAEQAEDDNQQKENQEYRGEVETDRMRLRHGTIPSRASRRSSLRTEEEALNSAGASAGTLIPARFALTCRRPVARMAETHEKILCIEDDRETAALIAEELVDRGYEVAVAQTGAKASPPFSGSCPIWCSRTSACRRCRASSSWSG